MTFMTTLHDFPSFEEHTFEGFEETKETKENNFDGFSTNEKEKQTHSKQGESKEGEKIKIKILQLNSNGCRGIRGKIVDLKKMIDKQKSDVMCIQESKLKVKEEAPEITGYTPDRQQTGTEQEVEL